MEKEINAGIKWLLKNWNKIPDSFKTDLRYESYSSYKRKPIENLSEDEHLVIMLLDRQKPSVLQSWDFDEERISINKNGKVVWGFDSGCSCPAPWHDNYPQCYCVSESWKEFTIKNISDFDEGHLDECLKRINEIKDAIK